MSIANKIRLHWNGEPKPKHSEDNEDMKGVQNLTLIDLGQQFLLTYLEDGIAHSRIYRMSPHGGRLTITILQDLLIAWRNMNTLNFDQLLNWLEINSMTEDIKCRDDFSWVVMTLNLVEQEYTPMKAKLIGKGIN